MVNQIKYNLTKILDKVEMRNYGKLIIAEVDGYGDGKFNLLFRYISGNNTTRTNVEMTAHVISKNIEMNALVLSENESIEFVMPEGYSLENTPKPNDKRVKIKQIPERYVAALKFSGRWTPSNFSSKSKQLLKELEKSNIKTKGNIFKTRYSGPLTPCFLRRNEVATEIKYT
jgi:hypothetical protein